MCCQINPAKQDYLKREPRLQYSKIYFWSIGNEESDLRSKTAINVVKKIRRTKHRNQNLVLSY